MDDLVMIVDDDEKVRKMLYFLFTTKGYRVETASNGREAMDQLKNIKPSVVILDLMMPEMDGITFYNELKRDYKLKDVPVIVLSAIPASDSVRKTIAIAEENYIEKPFKSSDLLGRAIKAMQ